MRPDAQSGKDVLRRRLVRIFLHFFRVRVWRPFLATDEPFDWESIRIDEPGRVGNDERGRDVLWYGSDARCGLSGCSLAR